MGIRDLQKNDRIALGSLLTKVCFRINDQEFVKQISENPYLHSFLCFGELLEKWSFDSFIRGSLRSLFRHPSQKEINLKIIYDATDQEDALTGDWFVRKVTEGVFLSVMATSYWLMEIVSLQEFVLGLT